MHNFELHLKTKLYFGEDQESKVGEIIKQYGFKNVLIFGGQTSLIKSGLLATVEKQLSDHGIQFHCYLGIRPNPEIIYVREALKLAREQHIDFILAIGGGSVIDVAKTVAVAYDYEGDPLDFNAHKVKAKGAIPIGVILTHSAAGSDMSTSAVISDSQQKFKQGFNSEFNRPLFTINNPRYTLTLSPEQTAIGIVDIMMHTLERYFNESSPALLSDSLAEALLANVIENANLLIDNPNNLEARANIMLANTFSHNGITGMGKDQKMPVHLLEHALSAKFPAVPHGAGLAIIFPAWARFYQRLDGDKFDRFARKVFNLHHEDKETNGRLAIVALEDLFIKMGLSLNLSSFGVSKKDLEDLADIVTKGGVNTVYHYIKPLDKNAVIAIYQDCL